MAAAAASSASAQLASTISSPLRTAGALNATLAVDQHEVRQRDGLLPVALLLEHARLARAVGERLVLQGALAALVAHGAVERMVDEQELEDTVLRLLHLR